MYHVFWLKNNDYQRKKRIKKPENLFEAECGNGSQAGDPLSLYSWFLENDNLSDGIFSQDAWFPY